MLRYSNYNWSCCNENQFWTGVQACSLSELTTDPSFGKDAKPVQLWNSKKGK
jgi:hypothetical protein